MNKPSFNKLIEETLKLGDTIINSNFDLNAFINYESNIEEIVKNGHLICEDELQLKTCDIIRNKKVEDYKLSLIERVFETYSKGYNEKVNSKNTDAQIRKRYIVDLNRFIPILK